MTSCFSSLFIPLLDFLLLTGDQQRSRGGHVVMKAAHDTHLNPDKTNWIQLTIIQVLASDLFGCFKVSFSGVKWPPFVWSKGHLEETGYELLWNTWVMNAPYTFRFNKQPLPSLCTGQMENLVQTVQTCTATSSQVRRAPQSPGDQSTRANRKRLTSEIGHILKPWKLAWNLKITWYEKEII